MSKPIPLACCGDDCCSETAAPAASAAGVASSDSADAVRDKVREGYAKIATDGGWSATAATNASAGSCCAPNAAGGGCCGPATFSPEQLATAIGYAQSELSIAPDGANMGLSCGNPTAIASLQPGEVVLDLGAGGGFDCFIAGAKVGATGRVIGVDMTPEMLGKARKNTAAYRDRTGFDNVEFRLGEIENLPVADASVDVVISNCVLNLSPDKPRVWREIARVLKPGGRVAVSDLALLRPLPDSVRADVEALVGCVAGAVLVDEIRSMATRVGLCELQLTSKPQYVAAMMNFDDPLYQGILSKLPVSTSPADFITSLDIVARKPCG
ncbi:MAG: arsenite methyltransferase [Phycisphaerae bacterium]